MYNKPITQRAKSSSRLAISQEVTIDAAGKIPGDFKHSYMNNKKGCGCGCDG